MCVCVCLFVCVCVCLCVCVCVCVSACDGSVAEQSKITATSQHLTRVTSHLIGTAVSIASSPA